MENTIEKPKCRLIGANGNVFNLAGIVSTTLKKAGQHDKAKEFTTKLFQCEDYNKALVLMMEYVDVE